MSLCLCNIKYTSKKMMEVCIVFIVFHYFIFFTQFWNQSKHNNINAIVVHNYFLSLYGCISLKFVQRKKRVKEFSFFFSCDPSKIIKKIKDRYLWELTHLFNKPPELCKSSSCSENSSKSNTSDYLCHELGQHDK